MKRIAIIALALLALVSCGEPPPKEGYVRDKSFEAAHWEGGFETYYTTEYRCHTVSSYNYASKSYKTSQQCGPEMVSRQRWEDHHTYVEDRWKIKLEDCKVNDKGERKCRTGWLTVDQQTYHEYRIGSHYPDPK